MVVSSAAAAVEKTSPNKERRCVTTGAHPVMFWVARRGVAPSANNNEARALTTKTVAAAENNFAPAAVNQQNKSTLPYILPNAPGGCMRHHHRQLDIGAAKKPETWRVGLRTVMPQEVPSLVVVRGSWRGPERQNPNRHKKSRVYPID